MQRWTVQERKLVPGDGGRELVLSNVPFPTREEALIWWDALVRQTANGEWWEDRDNIRLLVLAPDAEVVGAGAYHTGQMQDLEKVK